MKLISFGVGTCGHGRELAVHDLPGAKPSSDPQIHRRFDLPINGWITALAFMPFGWPSPNRARFPQYGWVLGTKIVRHKTTAREYLGRFRRLAASLGPFSTLKEKG